VVEDIRPRTRRHFSAEGKISIVLEGLRGDGGIAGLHRSRTGPIHRSQQDEPCARYPLPSADPGQDRALAQGTEESRASRKLLPARRPREPEALVEHYNHLRDHESLDNATSADAYFGRAPAIIKRRERIRRQTLEHRRLQHRKLAA
jgi:hypothetical protein